MKLLKIAFVLATVLLLENIRLVQAQEISRGQLKNTWFKTMLALKQASLKRYMPSGADVKKEAALNYALWKSLRKAFNDPQDLLEMSWEQRDSIWYFHRNGFSFDLLGKNYVEAYRVSCEERGVKPDIVRHSFKNIRDVNKIRKRYLASRKKEYVILTPEAPASPRINGPHIFGVRPGHPVLYKIPVTGRGPIKVQAINLPTGCKLNGQTGVLTGTVNIPGTYHIKIVADNDEGTDSMNFALKVGDEIALTPPMGWSSWNCFASDVTAKDIRDAAERFVKSGLINYGWSYINIDDCWMRRPAPNNPIFGINGDIENRFASKERIRERVHRIRINEDELVGKVRDEQGNVLPNESFPDMNKLTDYIHSLGLKAGIYTSPGPVTCQNYIGSYGHELQDLKQYAAWGFDYLKYDYCSYSWVAPDNSVNSLMKPYKLMGKLLTGINRDMVYSICEYGRGSVWKWGAKVGGNLWRLASDMEDTWERMSKIAASMNGKAEYAGPGHWNDPDYLVIGYVGKGRYTRPTRLSPNEQYTQMSLWCLFSAPLMIGADLTKLDPFTLGILTNSEVLAVDQDRLGKQAKVVLKDGPIEVLLKPLADGSFAVGVFNMGEKAIADYELDFSLLGLQGEFSVRNLWIQKDIAHHVTLQKLSINRHDVKLLKLIPENQ